MNEIFYYDSPIGIIEITISDCTITSLIVVKKAGNVDVSCKTFLDVKIQLDEYFAGVRTNFDLNISPKGTDFQKRVWSELVRIPYGSTKSYQEIAELIGSPNSQRAVGLACNKNPIILLIPCHRVISKLGNLTGFAYGINKKEFLLNLENAL